MDKRCIGCNAPMPRGATWKGWHIVQRSAPGMGQFTYRNCGCLPTATFNLWLDDLFDQHRAYPPKAWQETWARVKASREGKR